MYAVSGIEDILQSSPITNLLLGLLIGAILVLVSMTVWERLGRNRTARGNASPTASIVPVPAGVGKSKQVSDKKVNYLSSKQIAELDAAGITIDTVAISPDNDVAVSANMPTVYQYKVVGSSKSFSSLREALLMFPVEVRPTIADWDRLPEQVKSMITRVEV